MTDSRPRIACVIDDLGYGGAQRQLSILVKDLTHRVEPKVYCLSQTTDPYLERIQGAGVEVVAFRRAGSFDLRRLGFLMRSLSEDKIDIVHGFLDSANIYAFVAARQAGRPCVLSLRSDRISLSGVRAGLLRRALRRTESVTTNSEAGARYLAERVRVDPDRIVVIPNAVAPGGESRLAGSTDAVGTPDGPVIGFVGRLVELKRVDMLIDAHAILLEHLPGAKLVIVGDGPEREKLEEQSRRVGIEHCVEFTGNVDDVGAYLRRFTCLALPSSREGSPNVALESLAAGIPVIASPVGDVESIVIDGKTGRLLREQTPQALAELLMSTAADDALLRRAREDGPSLIRENHSVDAAVQKTLALYATLAAHGTDPGTISK